MATLELNGKDFATQTSTAEPVLASTVTGGAGLMPTGVTSLGTVTAGNLSNTNIVYPSGHIIKTQHTFLPTENYVSNAGTSYVNYWSPTYTPLKNNSIVYAWLHLMGSSSHNGNWQPVWTHKYSISGANITNLTDCEDTQRGWSNATTTDKQTWMEIQHMNLLNPVTLDGTGTGTITYALSFKNNNSNWYSHTLRILGWTSGTDSKGSSILFQEVAP